MTPGEGLILWRDKIVHLLDDGKWLNVWSAAAEQKERKQWLKLRWKLLAPDSNDSTRIELAYSTIYKRRRTNHLIHDSALSFRVVVEDTIFFGPHLWHAEVPGPWIQLASQQWPTPRQWQCQIFNPLTHQGKLATIFNHISWELLGN